METLEIIWKTIIIFFGALIVSIADWFTQNRRK